MTADEIRAFLERFRLAWERHDLAAITACYAEECVVISPIFRTLNSRSEVEKSFADIFRIFGNQTIRVDDVVIGSEEPARAVMVWNLQSIHAGEIFGIPPSGRKIDRTVAFVLTFKDGLIVKETRVYDFTSMLIELGVLRAKPAH